MPSKSMIDACIKTFLERNKLPDSYRATAQNWFIPILEDIALHHNGSERPLLLGVNGAQGSGKSTFTEFAAMFLTQVLGKTCIGFSIDDFYFSKAKRRQLAKDVHPLLETRGVPGTHDIALLKKTIQYVMDGKRCLIPRFDKAIDDLMPTSEWHINETKPDFVIIEGWCVGSVASDSASLQHPINQLEKDADPSGQWRHYVNQQLSLHYQPVFNLIDRLIMLKAPSFQCVYQWRVEQEHKMLDRLKEQNQDIEGLGMTDQQIANFISYYQRITEDNIARMPEFCDVLFNLDSNRNVISCQQN